MTLDRRARSCFTSESMATYSLGFFKEAQDKRGEAAYSGYGIVSIQDFALNVAHVVQGGSLGDLAGTYADGDDVLQVTKATEAAQRSLEARQWNGSGARVRTHPSTSGEEGKPWPDDNTA